MCVEICHMVNIDVPATIHTRDTTGCAVTKLTGAVSQVLLMNRSLPDDWSYDRVMLQLLGAAGTVRKMTKSVV